MKCSKS